MLAQHLQVLGDRRLGDGKLVPNDFHDLAGRTLAAAEDFEGAPPYRVAEYLEGVHQSDATGSPV